MAEVIFMSVVSSRKYYCNVRVVSPYLGWDMDGNYGLFKKYHGALVCADGGFGLVAWPIYLGINDYVGAVNHGISTK